MREVVIVAATRTAIGTFGGALKDITPAVLGSTVIKSALEKAKLKPEEVNEVYFGCVLQAGYGQGVARQASLGAGLPVEVPASTINMICGSGLKTVSLAYNSIAVGENEIVVAGGTENMSMTPYLMKSARWGMRMGNSEVYDPMVKDGLWDVYNDYHMGVTAENIATQWSLTKEEQDEFAFNSQMKASKAQNEGRFKDEITPVVIPSKKGDIIFENDEYIKHDANLDKIKALKPAFKKDGTVSAGSSSGINDGASAIILMSKELADKKGIKPLATIVSHASAGVDPSIMGIGPVPSSQKALRLAGLTIDDIDLVEANEAFASQSIAVARELKLDPKKVNVNGGAIALGHPIGASGARILTTLIHEMIKRESKYGLATLCIGGGMGEAVIIKR